MNKRLPDAFNALYACKKIQQTTFLFIYLFILLFSANRRWHFIGDNFHEMTMPVMQIVSLENYLHITKTCLYNVDPLNPTFI